MILKECIFYNSACYNWTSSNRNLSTVKGIVVHSTGANNPNLKRYVQPTKKNAEYSDILADIGKNAYGNHWNTSSANVLVHAFIGKNAAGTVETYQVLPYDRCCWGCGKSSKGSYNYGPNAHIQFEICEDGLADKAYFSAVMKEAQEYCAYLCKRFNLDANTVVSHAEAHKKGYASNHGDIDHWLVKFGKDMDWFREEVKKLIDGETVPEKTSTVYRIRVGKFANKKSANVIFKKLAAAGFPGFFVSENGVFSIQVGAFSVKAYADDMLAKVKAAGFDAFIKTD